MEKIMETKTEMNNQEETARFRIERNGKYGFIDKAGNEVIPCQYEKAGVFSDGRAWIRVGDKYGYIDPSGQVVVIPCKYDEADSFYEGVGKSASSTRRARL